MSKDKTPYHPSNPACHNGSLIDVIVCAELLLEYFNGDADKVNQWFSSDNPNFGGLSPRYLIGQGKIDKVLHFIKESLND